MSVVDEHPREFLLNLVDRSISTVDVIEVVDVRGVLQALWRDNGSFVYVGFGS